MLRYKTETRPGLVALYDIRPVNGAGPFLQPRSPQGADVPIIIRTLEPRPLRIGGVADPKKHATPHLKLRHSRSNHFGVRSPKKIWERLGPAPSGCGIADPIETHYSSVCVRWICL